MTSKMELNNKLLKKSLERTIKTGENDQDVYLSYNRVSRKCFKCGERFTTFKKTGYIYCKECCKIRKNKVMKK